jgi:hypothetical protein
MRKLLALAFCFGCSNGSDRTFEGVQALDRSTLEDHVYYIDLSVADTPLTADEVQDAAGAIPVRLLVNDRVVVAFGLDPALGSDRMDRVMGVWKVNRDLVPNGGADDESVGTGGEGTSTPDVQSRVTRPTQAEMAPASDSAMAEIFIDWEVDVLDIGPDELDVLIDFHPGCI